MNYIEVSFKISPFNQENEDLLIAKLSLKNFDSFWNENNLLKAYIQEDLYDEVDLNTTKSELSTIFDINWVSSNLENKNWNEIWESSFNYITIADECIIKAPFHNNTPKYKFEITIEPKMAFGTGHHATTALVMELMLKYDFKAKSVLDMGCGTGILAILAKLKNASNIIAIDYDELAVNNTIENAKLNNCEMSILKGTANEIPNMSFDFILANINRNILLNDIKLYCNHLANNGLIFVSGFLTNDIVIIENEALKNNLKLEKSLTKNDWVAQIYSKSNN